MDIARCTICKEAHPADEMERCAKCGKTVCYMCYDYDKKACVKCVEKTEEDRNG